MSDEFFTCYAAFWLAALGAVLGSFFDCLAWRRAHGESVWQGRSHCGTCGHVLGVRDLIPVFSYLFCRGRCRYCKAKIPVDALFAELAGMASFALLTLKTGLEAELVMWLIFATLLLLLSLIDLQERLIPDALLAAAVVNRLVFLLILGDAASKLVPMLTGALSVSVLMLAIVLVMDRVLGRESMGGGDIKLLFVLGLYLNWMQMLLLLFAACIFGIVAALFMRRRDVPVAESSVQDRLEESIVREVSAESFIQDTLEESVAREASAKSAVHDTLEEPIAPGGKGIPFGPCLAAAGILVYVCGQPLIDWYVGLLV